MGTVWSCLSENLAENLLRYTVHMIAMMLYCSVCLMKSCPDCQWPRSTCAHAPRGLAQRVLAQQIIAHAGKVWSTSDGSMHALDVFFVALLRMYRRATIIEDALMQRRKVFSSSAVVATHHLEPFQGIMLHMAVFTYSCCK